MARSDAAGPSLLLALWVVTAGCSGDAASRDRPTHAVRDAALPAPESRIFHEEADFEAAYWSRPIPPQGAPPEHFDSLEASLHPAACGTCHQRQYADWQTTLHSSAYSPGLSGQLVDVEDDDPAFVQSCAVCHAPLSEQAEQLLGVNGGFVDNPDFDAELRDRGLVCAACHVRGNRRYGPPRRDGSLNPSPAQAVHEGVTARARFFEDSRFCAACHQHDASFPAPNGKPLENTYAEWSESRYPRDGVTCQSCHMPDRRHLWRGIHDPEMVASGVTIEWTHEPDDSRAGLRLTNSGTGHHFPTYVTPEVRVRLWLLDADGRMVEKSAVESTIARIAEFRSTGWVELDDRRIPADSSTLITVDVADPRATAVRATVTVLPDEFYRKFFETMLDRSRSDSSRALLEAAHRNAVGSPFVIFDDTLELR